MSIAEAYENLNDPSVRAFLESKLSDDPVSLFFESVKLLSDYIREDKKEYSKNCSAHINVAITNITKNWTKYQEAWDTISADQKNEVSIVFLNSFLYDFEVTNNNSAFAYACFIYIQQKYINDYCFEKIKELSKNINEELQSVAHAFVLVAERLQELGLFQQQFASKNPMLTIICNSLMWFLDVDFSIEFKAQTIACLNEIFDNISFCLERRFCDALKVIFKNLEYNSENYDNITFELLYKIFPVYYDTFGKGSEPLMQIIFEDTFKFIKKSTEQKTISALKFWSVVAKTEVKIMIENNKLRLSRKKTLICYNFALGASEILWEYISQIITKKDPNFINKEKVSEETSQTAAIKCIKDLYKIDPENIFREVNDFILEKINSNRLNEVYGSLLLLSEVCTFNNPLVYSLVDNCLFNITRFINSECPRIRETSLWVTAKIIRYFPQLISQPDMAKTVLELAIIGLQEEEELAISHSLYILSTIVSECPRETLDQIREFPLIYIYENVVGFLNGRDKEIIDYSFDVLNAIIQNAEEKDYDLIREMINYVMNPDFQFDTKSSVCYLLLTLKEYLEDIAKEQIETISNYLVTLANDSEAYNEAFTAINSYFEFFNDNIESLPQMMKSAISNINTNNSTTVEVATDFICNVAIKNKIAMNSYAESVTRAITEEISNENIVPEVLSHLIYCLTVLVRSLSDYKPIDSVRISIKAVQSINASEPGALMVFKSIFSLFQFLFQKEGFDKEFVKECSDPIFKMINDIYKNRLYDETLYYRISSVLFLMCIIFDISTGFRMFNDSVLHVLQITEKSQDMEAHLVAKKVLSNIL